MSSEASEDIALEDESDPDIKRSKSIQIAEVVDVPVLAAEYRCAATMT